MDKFPDTFNRKICNDRMAKNQFILIKEVRKNFVDIVEKAVEDCSQYVTLEFPDRLWHEHKTVIIRELLERFGKIKVQTSNVHANVVKIIQSIEDIPNNVKKVIIEFIKDE